MHTILLYAAGIMLLAVFCLLGHLWGRGAPDVIRAAWAFLPAWAGVALVNLWVGVRHAGYPLSAELPILVVVFVVPALMAVTVIWFLAR